MPGKRHILVVDDETYIADVLCRRFERMGFSVESADSLTSAALAIKAQPPDIVVCDVQIDARNDARDVYALAKAHNPAVHLVAMSGHAKDAPSVQKVLLTGVEIFLKKPFVSLKETSERIAALLGTT